MCASLKQFEPVGISLSQFEQLRTDLNFLHHFELVPMSLNAFEQVFNTLYLDMAQLAASPHTNTKNTYKILEISGSN